MHTPFIRIRNRMINVAAISYVRLYEDLDRIDIRLLGPAADVSLTVTVDGEEAVPVRDFFLSSGIVGGLRPVQSEPLPDSEAVLVGVNGT